MISGLSQPIALVGVLFSGMLAAASAYADIAAEAAAETKPAVSAAPAAPSASAAAPAPKQVCEPPPDIKTDCYEFFHANEDIQGVGPFSNPTGDKHLLCADLRDASNPKVCEPRAWYGENGRLQTDCVDAGYAIEPNRLIKVHIWRAGGTKLTMTLSGTPGVVSGLYDATNPPAVAARAAGCELPPIQTTQSFAPRKEEFIDLKFTVTNPTSTDLSFEFSQPFRVKRAYRYALRTGLAGMWAPWDRKYAARESGDPANPGKEVVVEQGADGGITTASLTLGLSIFAATIDNYSLRPTFSWYFGLGLLSGNAKGVDAMTSAVTGPEISFGKDFSVALVAGAARTRKLDQGLVPGSALPQGESEVPTTFAFTPAFGVMLNLAPYVWDSVPH
jgi:hypothetical protein